MLWSKTPVSCSSVTLYFVATPIKYSKILKFHWNSANSRWSIWSACFAFNFNKKCNRKNLTMWVISRESWSLWGCVNHVSLLFAPVSCYKNLKHVLIQDICNILEHSELSGKIRENWIWDWICCDVKWNVFVLHSFKNFIIIYYVRKCSRNLKIW